MIAIIFVQQIRRQLPTHIIGCYCVGQRRPVNAMCHVYQSNELPLSTVHCYQSVGLRIHQLII